jgi:hypothetical protein
VRGLKSSDSTERMSTKVSGGHNAKLKFGELFATENLTTPSHLLNPTPSDAALKRRARLLITTSSIPRQTRSLIRYALEIKDPHLAQVLHRVERGEMTIEHLYVEIDDDRS